MPKIKRILLECTHTYETDMNTGIQRVVRNIIKQSWQVGNKLNIKCQPVIVAGRRFQAINKMKNKRGTRVVVIDFLKKIYRQLGIILHKVFPFRTIEKLSFPVSWRLGLLNVINLMLNILFSLGMIDSRKRTVLHKGDLLLLLDSSWVYPIWPAVRRAKEKGAVIGLVVYDIIQITHPQFFKPLVVKRFQKWFDQSIDNVDFYIAISKTVRDQIASYIASNHPSDTNPIQFESFRLGSVIENVEKDGHVRAKLQKIFQNKDCSDTYLAVGTIEPRKNYKYLLDTFDKVWEKCPNASLCIVGRTSWLCEELPKHVKSHQKYGKHLFMFNDASDTELDYCYSHAKALIFPSHAEGFGLPIVESLYHGLPVLASDIPIHREVGKDFCLYFDINDPADLTNIIINIEKTGKMPEVRSPEQYDLPTWEDSCRELQSKAVALFEKVPT